LPTQADVQNALDRVRGEAEAVMKAVIILDLRKQAARCQEIARHLSLRHEIEELVALAQTYEARARVLEAQLEECIRSKPDHYKSP
jgi:hypothetical protein